MYNGIKWDRKYFLLERGNADVNLLRMLLRLTEFKSVTGHADFGEVY